MVLLALEAFVLRKKTERRGIQELFTPKATLIATITNVDSSGGLVRITAASHGLSTGDEVIIAGVAGTTEANGYWTVTVTSTSQFTLDSSTYATAWTSGGGVYNGISYTVVCGSAPGSNGICVVNNYKQISTAGAVVATPVTIKVLTSTTETEIMLASADYAQAVSSLILTNDSGGSISGSIKVRTTKLLGFSSKIVIPWTLPDDYSLVVGGDGVRSLYKGDALPYVS